MNAVAPLTDHYVGAFSASRAQLPGGQLDWLASIRDKGIAAFAERGFPTPRDERWKYTNVWQLTRHQFVTAPQGGKAALSGGLNQAWLQQLETHRLTFVCLLYTSPNPRDGLLSRMPSSA